MIYCRCVVVVVLLSLYCCRCGVVVTLLLLLLLLKNRIVLQIYIYYLVNSWPLTRPVFNIFEMLFILRSTLIFTFSKPRLVGERERVEMSFLKWFNFYIKTIKLIKRNPFWTGRTDMTHSLYRPSLIYER